MIWFTADWHLSHRNIIKYCERPFKNTHYMNKTILKNYCDVVGEDDQVYFLGDMTMMGPSEQNKVSKQLEDLPGIKHLVLGNHDKFKPFTYHEMGFSSVHTALQTTFHHLDLAFGAADFLMAHDPAWAQIPETIWICGHIHNHWVSQKTDTNTIIVNVGVDVWNFKPVSLDQVVDEIGKYAINGRKLAKVE